VFRNSSSKLVVEVEDTGIGISEEYLKKIFTPFTQEEMGYTRKFDGNGIGLSLVKNYCELNKAEVQVESEKGVGSVLRVIFNK
jgi:signal transduction histidine kinase